MVWLSNSQATAWEVRVFSTHERFTPASAGLTAIREFGGSNPRLVPTIQATIMDYTDGMIVRHKIAAIVPMQLTAPHTDEVLVRLPDNLMIA